MSTIYFKTVRDYIEFDDVCYFSPPEERVTNDVLEITDTLSIRPSLRTTVKLTEDNINFNDRITRPIIINLSDSINLSDFADHIDTFLVQITIAANSHCSATSQLPQTVPNPIFSKLNGMVINQNQFDNNLTNLKNAFVSQEFKLPSDYIRSGQSIPQITGLQIYLNAQIYLENDTTNITSVKYSIDQRVDGSNNWNNLASGQQTVSIPNHLADYASDQAEPIWLNIDSFKPIDGDASWIDSTFRFTISEFSNSIQGFYYETRPKWSSTTSYVEGDVIYETINGNIFGYLCIKNNTNKEPRLYSEEAAINQYWQRDPFADYSMVVSGKDVQNQPPANDLGQLDGVLTFRLLSAVADEGTDFLNNQFRSSIFISDATNVTSLNSNKVWTSKPNPSKFGVENLYFDVKENNQSVNLDSVLVDPITPGLFFNVYYSNDISQSATPETDAEWENLYWIRVPKTFRATKRQNYIFPDPISAKYIKIEFSNLQASYYAPGDFQKPILYKKYPQWVFDYFIADYLAKRNQTYDPFIQGEASVTLDVYALAYDYYKGDIIQSPSGAVEIKDFKSDRTQLLGLITNKQISNTYDSETLSRIKSSFDSFTSHPASGADNATTIGKAANNLATSTYGLDVQGYKIMTAQNYPIEQISTAIADTALVSTTDREPLLLEKNISPMFFYVNCRHEYKEAYAKFEDNKAYFASIKEIIFQKQNHTSQYDSNIYNYGVNENSLNIEHNDFVFSSDESINKLNPQGFWSAE
jgi:hypothetical protein